MVVRTWSLVASLGLLSCSSPSADADSSVSGGSPSAGFTSGGLETATAGSSAIFASGNGSGGSVAAGSGGAAPQAEAASDWYDDSFKRRRLVTADPSLGVDEALCDFPAPLVLPADTFAPGTVRPDGADLKFVDATGEVVSHELEVWSASGESLVWLRFPKLPVPAAIYMYYDSPDQAPDAEAAAGVWKPPYAAVWHFAGNAKDASAQHRDGAVIHAAFAPGKLGQAAKFSAAAQDHIGLAHGSSLVAGAATVVESAWVRTAAIEPAAYGVVLGIGTANITGHLSRTSLMVWGNTANYPYGGQSLHNALYAEINPDEADGGWAFGASPAQAITTDAWHYLTVSYDVAGKAVTLYADGKALGGPLVNPGKGGGAPAAGGWTSPNFGESASDRVEIGAEEDVTHGFFDGLVDELRVETDARSPIWIAAQAQVAAGIAVSVGPEQQH